MAENPGTASVEELLKLVNQGDYAIPHFQRGFEWRPRMVGDLIQSIIQNYYTGLLLLWELNQNQANNDQWDPVWGANLSGNPTHAILDGQQRLSSLYYALYNPKNKFPNRKSYYAFYIDLVQILNQDFDNGVGYKFFTYYRSWENFHGEKDRWTKTGKVPLNILSVNHPTETNKSFIDSREFYDWSIEFLENHSQNLSRDIVPHDIRDIFNSILKYQFVYYPLNSDRDIHDICNIFARVNEKGMKLSTFDLLNAFLYPKGVELRKDLWENLDKKLLKNVDSNMSEYLLKLISLVKQNYCSSKYLYNLIPEEKTIRKDKEGNKHEVVFVSSGDEFKRLWHISCRHAEKARETIMNTGEADFGAIKTDYIPNTTMIPVLGALLWIFEGDVDKPLFKNYLQKWYWSAAFSEDYSGSSDTVMAKDFRDWKLWLDTKAPIERIKKINREYIQEVDFKTIRKGSSRYNVILCLLALNNASDFFKNRQIGSGDYSNSRINDHHIFPSKVNGLVTAKSRYFRETKDTIVNRTLLFDETNGKIKNKKPSEYLDEIIKKYNDKQKAKVIFKRHFITESAYNFLKNDDYDQFILEREKAIKEHLINKLELA
jgi:hypothetical protein